MPAPSVPVSSPERKGTCHPRSPSRLQLSILFIHVYRHCGGRPLTAQPRLPERIGLTGLCRAGDTWSVRIEPFNSNLGGSIYGGAELGAAVDVLESAIPDRPEYARTPVV